MVALETGVMPLRARRIDQAERDDIQTGGTTPMRHLFTPHTDDRPLARWSQDQSRGIWRGDVIIPFQPDNEHEVID